MVRIQLETGYLDVKEGTVFPLNFGVADVRDLTARSGVYSKTITLTGTANNHNLLNHYYDVNVVAGTFDINALTPCAVIQDGVPIVEDAYLQLIAVNKVQKDNGYDEDVEYEVLIKDVQSDFFTQIDQGELTDLDFMLGFGLASGLGGRGRGAGRGAGHQASDPPGLRSAPGASVPDTVARWLPVASWLVRRFRK